MKKKAILKVTLCMGATAFLIGAANPPKVDSAAIAAETGLAGISLTLDRYYSSALGGSAEAVKASADSVSKAAIDQLTEPTGNDVNENKVISNDINETNETNDSVPEAPVMQSNMNPAELPPEELLPPPTPVSEYENVGISVAEGYVHIRRTPDAEGEIAGKLYRGSASTILEREGEWVKIKSGTTTGYIKEEFLAVGFAVEDLIEQYGTKWAEITGVTVYLREKPNTDCEILSSLALGETFRVLEELEGWTKVEVDVGGEGENGETDEGTTGYVSSDFVKVSVEFEHAISVEEELEKLRQEEEARLAEEEQARKLREAQEKQAEEERQAQEERQREQQQSQSSNKNTNSSSNNSKSSTKKEQPQKEAPSQPLKSGNGADIAAYAKKFKGNPYVWGGTSLTKGADCSGFTMRVYSDFGISIPRTSSEQSRSGAKVSLSSVQPGDLIFYSGNGRINHVALYIGGGSVVHASTSKTGIKISNMYYRTPHSARRYVS